MYFKPYLHKKFASYKYLFGRSEYDQFKETNPNYITGKDDPGDEFMLKVRQQLTGLNLKYKPE
jgi:hypothetical protein